MRTTNFQFFEESLLIFSRWKHFIIYKKKNSWPTRFRNTVVYTTSQTLLKPTGNDFPCRLFAFLATNCYIHHVVLSGYIFSSPHLTLADVFFYVTLRKIISTNAFFLFIFLKRFLSFTTASYQFVWRWAICFFIMGTQGDEKGDEKGNEKSDEKSDEKGDEKCDGKSDELIAQWEPGFRFSVKTKATGFHRTVGTRLKVYKVTYNLI